MSEWALASENGTIVVCSWWLISTTSMIPSCMIHTYRNTAVCIIPENTVEVEGELPKKWVPRALRIEGQTKLKVWGNKATKMSSNSTHHNLELHFHAVFRNWGSLTSELTIVTVVWVISIIFHDGTIELREGSDARNRFPPDNFEYIYLYKNLWR